MPYVNATQPSSPAVDSGTVQAALCHLNDVVETCHKSLDTLRTNLVPVSLLPSEKDATLSPLSCALGYGVPYVDGIEAIVQKLRDLRARIDETGDRLRL